MSNYVFSVAEVLCWLQSNDLLRYWYGCHGQRCSEDLLQRKRAQYPKHYTDDRLPTYRKHIAAGDGCADCVGAIKYAFWSNLGKRNQVYGSNGMPDVSADGLFRYAKSIGCDWGPISTIPERPGIAVRYAGHVGYYLGNGKVREWRGFKYGRVDTALNARNWTHWYELPHVDYGAAHEAQRPIEVCMLGSRTLRRGSEGDDVAELQRLLMTLGYDLGSAGDDGKYGQKTENAVKAFQRRENLGVDGIYGPNTHRALMDTRAENEAEDRDDTEAIAPRYVEITGDTVNVRAGAGTHAEIVTVVRKGAYLRLVATADNGWHAVALDDGRAGWVGPAYSKEVT